MDNEVEQRIRERAYQLWVQNGEERGRAEEYWLQAERELMGAPNEGSVGSSVPAGTDGGTFEASAGSEAPKAPRRPSAKTAPKGTKAVTPKQPS